MISEQRLLNLTYTRLTVLYQFDQLTREEPHSMGIIKFLYCSNNQRTLSNLQHQFVENRFIMPASTLTGEINKVAVYIIEFI